VFSPQKDVIGLHIEVKTLDEFQEIAADLAPQLTIENM
jgi:hypothetical protein